MVSDLPWGGWKNIPPGTDRVKSIWHMHPLHKIDRCNCTRRTTSNKILANKETCPTMYLRNFITFLDPIVFQSTGLLDIDQIYITISTSMFVTPLFRPPPPPSVQKLTSIPTGLSQIVLIRVWNVLRVKTMHLWYPPIPLDPRDTQGSPGGSTSKFTDSKKFVNKSCFVWFTNDKNLLYK